MRLRRLTCNAETNRRKRVCRRDNHRAPCTAADTDTRQVGPEDWQLVNSPATSGEECRAQSYTDASADKDNLAPSGSFVCFHHNRLGESLQQYTPIHTIRNPSENRNHKPHRQRKSQINKENEPRLTSAIFTRFRHSENS